MQMELLWLSHKEPQAFQIVDNRPVVIGRRKDCDIVLPDKTVSRRHAEVFVKHGHFQLHNLSQTNAIFIYSKQNVEFEQQAVLKRGDAIQLGIKQLRLLSVQRLADGHILKLGTAQKTYFVSAKQPILIGRHENCDIVLENKTVSRQHAEIFSQHGHIYVRTLSQRSPLYLHLRQRLAQGKIMSLKTGDAFKLGPTQIRTQAVVDLLPQTAQDLAGQTLGSLYHVKCHNCQHQVKATEKDCPWCGLVLACGLTI